MKTEKSGIGRSALKKLIPAVAMLVTSTLMLSTATYAWFTMNKEVKITGLNMSATASEGIEIALASVVGTNITFSGATYDGNHPSDADTEEGWKSAVTVGNYYSDIGKLKPASSVDGANLYYATNASNKGKTASEFKLITLNEDSMAKVTTKDTFVAGDAVLNSDNTPGYYVDIPVHIRTSKQKTATEESGALYCKMILNNNNGDAVKNTLYKAVRVTFVPFGESPTKIFGCDSEYYSPNQAVNGTNDSRGTVTVETDDTNFVSTTNAFVTGTGVDSGLLLPYGVDGNYGHLDFYVRVWLEGESTSCYDDKAGQEWNISLAFCLGEFDSESSDPGTP